MPLRVFHCLALLAPSLMRGGRSGAWESKNRDHPSTVSPVKKKCFYLRRSRQIRERKALFFLLLLLLLLLGDHFSSSHVKFFGVWKGKNFVSKGMWKSKNFVSKGVGKCKIFVSKGVWKCKNFVSKGVWKGKNFVKNTIFHAADQWKYPFLVFSPLLGPHEKDRQFSTLSNKGPPSPQPFSILWSYSTVHTWA